MTRIRSAFYITVILLVLAAQHSCMAQDVKMRIPIISLGRIRPPEIRNGKPVPTPSTKLNVLKLPMLVADLNNCRVVSYKFAMIAPGKAFYGPIYVPGADITDSLKSVIRHTDGPGVKLYFEDIRMLYRGDTLDANPVYIQYDE